MGFYTVLSLNRIDVNVRDIFASGELPHSHFSLPPPPPHPLLKVPNPTFKVVSWYCGVDGFNKKTHGTIPTPYHKNEPTMVSATPPLLFCVTLLPTGCILPRSVSWYLPTHLRHCWRNCTHSGYQNTATLHQQTS